MNTQGWQEEEFKEYLFQVAVSSDESAAVGAVHLLNDAGWLDSENGILTSHDISHLDLSQVHVH